MSAISGKSPEALAGMDSAKREQLAATAALFPSEFEDSELGEIPRGWSVSTIGDEFSVTMGQSPPGSTYNEEGKGMPFFQGRRDFGWRYPENRVYCTEPKRLAEKGDTLLSVRAPVGDINKATSNCCIGRGISALRHTSNSEAYTYYLASNLKMQFENFDSEGTVFGSISQKNLRSLLIVKPADSFIVLFESCVGDIDKQIMTLEVENQTLAQLRDTLLPKLLSGELSVSAAQDFVSGVAS